MKEAPNPRESAEVQGTQYQFPDTYFSLDDSGFYRINPFAIKDLQDTDLPIIARAIFLQDSTDLVRLLLLIAHSEPRTKQKLEETLQQEERELEVLAGGLKERGIPFKDIVNEQNLRQLKFYEDNLPKIALNE